MVLVSSNISGYSPKGESSTKVLQSHPSTIPAESILQPAPCILRPSALLSADTPLTPLPSSPTSLIVRLVLKWSEQEAQSRGASAV